jgi:hypothetical protein
MSSAEIYRGWIIEARPVFCVQVWSAAGECVIPIHNAQTQEEALHLAKRWIDLQMTPDGARPQPSDSPPPDFDDDDIPFARPVTLRTSERHLQDPWESEVNQPGVWLLGNRSLFL